VKENTSKTNNNKKIKSFKDLLVWQEGHALVLALYKETKNYPREEKFSLIDQIKRAAISVTSNIAEGFSRKSYKEKLQFYYLSLGSVTELENQLLISRDLKYITQLRYEEVEKKIVSVHKLLNLLITKTRTFI
jgi:four helix bundle protein